MAQDRSRASLSSKFRISTDGYNPPCNAMVEKESDQGAVMELILQNPGNGLFVGEAQPWVHKSQFARKFSSSPEATRFANAARFRPAVRIVARFEQEREAILLPLLGKP